MPLITWPKRGLVPHVTFWLEGGGGGLGVVGIGGTGGVFPGIGGVTGSGGVITPAVGGTGGGTCVVVGACVVGGVVGRGAGVLTRVGRGGVDVGFGVVTTPGSKVIKMRCL